jgi:hypothetical protein
MAQSRAKTVRCVQKASGHIASTKWQVSCMGVYPKNSQGLGKEDWLPAPEDMRLLWYKNGRAVLLPYPVA